MFKNDYVYGILRIIVKTGQKDIKMRCIILLKKPRQGFQSKMQEAHSIYLTDYNEKKLEQKIHINYKRYTSTTRDTYQLINYKRYLSIAGGLGRVRTPRMTQKAMNLGLCSFYMSCLGLRTGQIFKLQSLHEPGNIQEKTLILGQRTRKEDLCRVSQECI